MTHNRRVSGEYADDAERMHTPGGMIDPAAPTGLSADGADMASTDMSQEPSSREDDTEPDFRGGGGNMPVEPDSQAVRRLEDRLDEERDRHLRSQAALVVRLLDVLDDMDRLTADGASASTDSLRQAVELVDRKLRKELDAAGLERIDPVGQPFDPSLHEAVSTVPPPSPDLDHQVSNTYQAGYRFKGSLVRPARVQVYSTQGQP